ncbi:MAG: roadblock/LC7 domain-containing protein [Candidatus Altiarchaeales archaeon]|nr:MAG: roadblock/LC7 domain-containing protein [Candidatus Altiarchaeales archaeon]RLI94336.1 MAG: roadblock/LC7 domain-containing protein [Candidatus Altiarchaeales archaeon]HDO82307.1 roadblock/LC7 domain-containing protein [Candidatus Altiarchaeales archaeon]HEX54956.1 roadblock/LC7 domain-containing protein [Candidatus Altiarchaeales archaeon]
MPKSKKDALMSLLEELANVGDIDGSAITTRDGLLVAAKLPSDVNAETFAAMSATMFGAAETAISELRKGKVKRVISEADDCKLVAVDAGPNAAVIALVRPEANLGLVLMEIIKAANATKDIMK